MATGVVFVRPLPIGDWFSRERPSSTCWATSRAARVGRLLLLTGRWSRLTLICYAVVLAIRVLKVPFIARHLLDWIERLLSSIQNIWLRLDERSVRLVHLACAGLVAAGGIALLWTLAPEMRGTPPPKHSPGAPLALELPDTPSPEAVIAFPDGSIRGGSATVEAMPGDRYTLTFRPAGRQLRPK